MGKILAELDEKGKSLKISCKRKGREKDNGKFCSTWCE